MGMSPDVGVREDGEPLSTIWRKLLVAGESWGARCDFRLWRSIMLTAQASRSTGVRFAAWRKGSYSWDVKLV